ncbi:hypothetical protein GNX18_09005 [Microbulbifer sp. SH-1]|nr:hypothetical protein [Microbulbifer sp. SH-1]QIL89874.1 hypothetical protein GNX18_09005 [Microbulbifer sp. SH-1]
MLRTDRHYAGGKNHSLVLIALLLLLSRCTDQTYAQQSYSSSNRFPCTNGAEVTEPENSPNGDKAIGVCGLNQFIEPADGASEIVEDFSIRSCWAWWGGNQWEVEPCEEPRNFTVALAGDTDPSGKNFVINGPSGPVPVDIWFRYKPSGAEFQFLPNAQSQAFPGAANGQQIPVEIRITPQSGQFAAGEYSGNFYFSLYQCEGSWQEPDCQSADSGGKANLEPALPFGVIVSQPTQIRISGLEDMHLLSVGEDIQASQTFCVFTTDAADFRLKADSLHGNASFQLKGISGDQTVEYDLRAWALIGPRRRTNLHEGSYTTTTWRGHAQQECNSGSEENMLLELTIPASRLQNLQAHSYQDTLTLTVEAE